MFIEKYQPYTSLIMTYDGEEIASDDPLPLPAVITGEYKVNLDAIGYDDVDAREALPFTRNDITWWLIDDATGKLTKEVDLDDGNGTKFTIDDSGTLSLTSVYYMAGEGDVLGVVCVLGEPSAFSIQELDIDVDIYTYIDFPFAEGGVGGGGDTKVFNTTTFHFKYDSTQSGSDNRNPIVITFVKSKYDANTNTYNPKTDSMTLNYHDLEGDIENLVQGSYITMYARPSTNNNWDISFVNTSTYSGYLTLIDEYNATINLAPTRVYTFEVKNVGEVQNTIDMTMHSKEESPIV